MISFTNSIILLSQKWRNLSEVLDALGKPHQQQAGEIEDPNYGCQLDSSALADQYHEVDLVDREVESIRTVKPKHPYIGYMPVPDEIHWPARTVVATQLSRETLVLETKKCRFRRATVRESTFKMSLQIDLVEELGSDELLYCVRTSGLEYRIHRLGVSGHKVGDSIAVSVISEKPHLYSSQSGKHFN